MKKALHASMKAKRVDKDEEKVLAHCEKSTKDSIEMAGLCKAVIFHHLDSHVCCLSCN